MISAEVNPDLLKLFIAVVKAVTDSAAPSPDILLKINASFVLFKVSSIDNPCLANSFAASATALKELPVFLATENRESPNAFNLLWDWPKKVFNSVNSLSTNIIDLAASDIALETK